MSVEDFRCECGERIVGEFYVCKCGRRWEWNSRTNRYSFRGGHYSFRIDFTIVKVVYNTVRKKSIKLICPKCGREGKLVRRDNGKSYRVRHDRGECCFGRSSEWYDLLDEIYKKVKRSRGV